MSDKGNVFWNAGIHLPDYTLVTCIDHLVCGVFGFELIRHIVTYCILRVGDTFLGLIVKSFKLGCSMWTSFCLIILGMRWHWALQLLTDILHQLQMIREWMWSRWAFMEWWMMGGNQSAGRKTLFDCHSVYHHGQLGWSNARAEHAAKTCYWSWDIVALTEVKG